MRVVCLSATCSPGAQRVLRHPAHGRLDLAARDREAVDAGDQVAAADVQVVGELDADRVRRLGGVELAVERLHGDDLRAPALGQDRDLVARVQRAAGHLARVAALAAGGLGRPRDPLDGQPQRALAAVGGDVDLLEVREQRLPVVPAGRAGLDDVVAVQRGDRERLRGLDAELLGQLGELALDLAEARLVPVDEVHLVDRGDEVVDAEQARQRGVAARLLDDAVAGVDQDHREVRRRRARDHVARVALVARGVGDDERAPRRREVAVGDVDRDALLALGAQAVGERREVGRAVRAVAVQRVERVVEEQLGVVEHPADQRRLAVVDRAGRGQAEELLAVGARPSRSTPVACGLPSRPRTCGRRRGSRRAR